MAGKKKAVDEDAVLDIALRKIEHDMGEGTMIDLEADGAQVDIEGIPTGALSLDRALGIGGMPRGRIVEVFGPESSGKTTLVCHVLAMAQFLYGRCLLIDAEHALDPPYAKRLGVKLDKKNLLFAQPNCGEDALELAAVLARTGRVAMVAIDSVAALTPRAELEGQMGDQTVGMHARMMSQAMRKLPSILSDTNTLLVFTNQIREKIGVTYGSPETQPGGRALPFAASQRLDIRRIATLKDGTEAVGNRVRVKVVKNKVAAPYRQAEFDIDFGKGISRSGCILDLGDEYKIITKNGAFHYYDGKLLGQGRPKAKAYLEKNPKLMDEIEAKIREAMEAAKEAEEQEALKDAEAEIGEQDENEEPEAEEPEVPVEYAKGDGELGLSGRLTEKDLEGIDLDAEGLAADDAPEAVGEPAAGEAPKAAGEPVAVKEPAGDSGPAEDGSGLF